MTQFLNLLNIEVETGRGYEPRRISEKVLGKLTQGYDFVLLIVTEDGESMWTRDEIVTARSRGIPVIPLVEEGATFAEGIFGDHEYIHFPKAQISEAYISLLEGIKYITPK